MSMTFRDDLALLVSSLFADDTRVFIEGHTYAEVIEIINNDLQKVSD